MKVAKVLGKISVMVKSLTLMKTIKWLGTAGVIIATILRAFGYHVEDMIIGFIGTALWAYASYKDRDMALLTCNVFILAVLIYGIVKGFGV
jgi:hypothetical protein